MKYSIYVRNYLKRKILNSNPNISKEEASKKADEEFKDILIDSFYFSMLEKLPAQDPLKKLEGEEEIRFLDLHNGFDVNTNIRNPYCYLYHGIRFDSDHEIFESILCDRKILCSNKVKSHWRCYSDNCNEGEYISLIDYSEEGYDLEFKTFIEENVSFIISPKLNPLKCKYLPFEEWEEIRKKLPKTKHRYSYQKNEYQYPDHIPFDYVVGILYPLSYYNHTKGFRNTKEDFIYIKRLLRKYDLEHLPILDPTDSFKPLDTELNDNHIMIHKRSIFNISHYFN